MNNDLYKTWFPIDQEPPWRSWRESILCLLSRIVPSSLTNPVWNSNLESLAGLVISYIRKWRGLPKCFRRALQQRNLRSGHLQFIRGVQVHQSKTGNEIIEFRQYSCKLPSSWRLGGHRPNQQQQNRQRKHYDSLWAKFCRDEVVLGQADQPGTRLPIHPKDASLW